ncbi:radial spoke head protein 9 homolog isoform X2 [Tachypleus tridentatus]|uniref:radial spoke head protein 9 homolog isoform X2 n=1 Tax=Tachypleus tridentatus TaxID=6853 RepID=UPI003FD35104
MLFIVNKDATVVPRGAVSLTPRREVTRNRSFEGLPFYEATKLYSYLHFPPGSKGSDLKQLRPQADVDVALDFLEPISNDVPQGLFVDIYTPDIYLTNVDLLHEEVKQIYFLGNYTPRVL